MNDEETRYFIWNFSPYTPVREDVVAEVVFVKKWQKLMLPGKIRADQEMMTDTAIKVDAWFAENESSDFPVLDVFKNGIPDEHDTRIASNMIRWLGTNNGKEFMGIAEDYTKMGIEPDIAYLAAWGKCNIRVHWVNQGRVARDWLIQSFDETRKAHPLRDIETLEQVVRWLGSDKGQAFIKSCQDNIDIKHRREHNARRAQWKLPPLAPS